MNLAWIKSSCSAFGICRSQVLGESTGAGIDLYFPTSEIPADRHQAHLCLERCLRGGQHSGVLVVVEEVQGDAIGTTRSSLNGRSCALPCGEGETEVTCDDSSSRCGKSQRLNCDLCLLISNWFTWCIDFKLQHSRERSVMKFNGFTALYTRCFCIHHDITHLGRLGIV